MESLEDVYCVSWVHFAKLHFNLKNTLIHTDLKFECESCWSYHSESISHPVVFGYSENVQTHRHCGNLKVLVSNLLAEVGARDAYTFKSIHVKSDLQSVGKHMK